MSTRTRCDCGMVFDVPDGQERCYCDCGKSWNIGVPNNLIQ